jgi:N6-adenosine-specific RNA methylase IME4
MTGSLLAVIPKTVPQAKKALEALSHDVEAAKTYDAIRAIERAADAIKLLFHEIEDIRHQAEEVVVLANHRIAIEVRAMPDARGGDRKSKDRNANKGRSDRPTLKEQVGSQKRGVALRKLAGIGDKAAIKKIVRTLQEQGRDATVTSVLKFVADETKTERRDARERELAGKIVALPDKRYGVIVADPEWRWEPWSRETGLDRSADNHYPTSCLDVIKARDVPSISAKDCVLWLWIPIPMLPHGLVVMAAWGFDYVSHYAWGKDKSGTGYWSREKHELLLVGTRGNVPCPAPGTQWDSLILAPRGAHSEKPDCVLAMIEQYFPNLPKIELNRRGPARPGWDAWGNEAEVQVEAAE